MGRFINPFTDFGFKFLFGREVEKELLIDFLNDLLVGDVYKRQALHTILHFNDNFFARLRGAIHVIDDASSFRI